MISSERDCTGTRAGTGAHSQRWSAPNGRVGWYALAAAYLAAGWLAVVHGAALGAPLPDGWAGVLRDGSLTLPLVLAAAFGGVRLGALLAGAGAGVGALGRLCSAAGGALGAAVAAAAGQLVIVALLGGNAAADPAGRLLTDALLALAVAVPLASVVVTTPRHRVLLRDQFLPPPQLPARDRWAVAPAGAQVPRGRARLAAAVAAILAAATLGALATPASPAAAAPAGVCATATRTINYDVSAIQVDLPLNGWGDHVPDGMIYALANADARPNAAQLKAEPARATPLVLRAAVGDCIVVHFRNEIAGLRVGMHVDGVAKDVQTSDGAFIGRNPDTTVATGQDRTYTWFAQREGQFPINDYGSGTDFKRTDPTSDTTSRGLYGGLVVLPAGSTWHDPVTGQNLLADADPQGVAPHGVGAPVFADVRVPGAGNDFRDYAQIFMDEPEGVLDRTGAAPTFPTTGLPDATFGFNYRSEPLRNRLRAVLDHQAGRTVTLPNGTVILPGDHFCDGWTVDQDAPTNAARLAKDRGLSSCLGEESHLQSWAFGDQGKLTRAVNEVDVLTVTGATGGTFRVRVADPTLTGRLTPAGAVDQTAARFPGERTVTDPIPFDATAADVQAALLALKVQPMAEPADGDIAVTGPAGGPWTIGFGQHLAGRDLPVAVDGSGLTGPGAASVAVTDDATAGGAGAEAAVKGGIEVLSDALLPKAYRGDPVRMRLIHPGVKETHPFHQHTNRWRQQADDPLSTRLDVQSIGPGQTFELVYEGGAGEAITTDPADPGAGAKSMDEWVRAGRPDLALLAVSKASNGDQIFHCHLYPHFAQGFWASLRVFDRLRPGAGEPWPAGTPHTYADATPFQALVPLPDFDFAVNGHRLTPQPEAAHPGYPLMVKGEYLQRAYRVPGSVVADRFGAPAQNWRRPGDTVRDYDSPATTDLERATMVTTTTASGAKRAIPGAFFIDPCPSGAPTRRYHPTAIDAKIVYNRAGWHDPDGKLYVEAPPSDPDRPDTSIDTADAIRRTINEGRWQPEPYNIRARLGECVTMRTTNATHLNNDPTVPLDIHDGQAAAGGPGPAGGALTGGNAFHLPTPMSELSTHVHLVRFDQLATDGTSVGWNYVQAPMVGQTYNYRWFADVALRTVYFHDHQNPNTHQQHGLWAAMNVEPPNATFNDPKSGALLTPGYCSGLSLPGTAANPACYGVGSVADIRVPDDPATGVNASFREFTVNYSDFVPLHDAAGQPINPPGEPDEYASDQGGMAINYRNEPFPIRVNSRSTGNRAEPAWVFSSAVHGDPSTPIFRAYPTDPVIFRFMGGAHEEGHNFTLSGHRWLAEPDDPNSNLYDSQFVMIAEWFNMEVAGTAVVKKGPKSAAVKAAKQAAQTGYGSTMVLPGGAGAPGDYLYGSMPLNDLWMGVWGIFRVHASKVADLQPLPSNPKVKNGGSPWPALAPGGDIRTSRPGTGDPCPKKAPVKQFAVSLVKQRIAYNAAGDHDPDGMAYVLDSELDAAGRPKAGESVKPLFIRANEGDCVQLTLTNRLPAGGVALKESDPINPVERIGSQGTSTVTNRASDGSLQTVTPSWPAGARASMHASGLSRTVTANSDGAAVGYNYDSTVGPGSSISYRHHLDNKDVGVINLADFGNLRTSRHHGAWGGLIVQPAGATYLDPATSAPAASGENVVIRYPDGAATRAHREFVIDFQDGLNLYDRNGNPIPDQSAPDVPGARVDPEDQGERGVNYRSEPFSRRIGTTGDAADVFSSTRFGDPATPVFGAYPGDPVMVRILNSQDLPRVHTFGITGHAWRYEPRDPAGAVINGQGGFNTGRSFNAGICAGSNEPLVFTGLRPGCGGQGLPGDYLFNDRNFDGMLSGGIWGLIRVHATTQPGLARLPT